MCQAAILHWWSSNRQRALYTNSLLNFGNQQFQAFTPVQSSFAGTESATADSFWLAAPVFNNLLAFNYPVSALPADFQVGVQRPTHRKMDGQKRQHPESGSPTYQRLKKSKSGLGRQAPRQQGDQKGRMAHMPELSSKLQKRLATLLVLVTADAEPETSGRKQACVQLLVISAQCLFLQLWLALVCRCNDHMHFLSCIIARNITLYLNLCIDIA